jgi:hypothetical protein
MLSESYKNVTGYPNADTWGWQLNGFTNSTSTYYNSDQFVFAPYNNGSVVMTNIQGWNFGDHPIHGFSLTGPNDTYYIGQKGYVSAIYIMVNSKSEVTDAYFYVATSETNFLDSIWAFSWEGQIDKSTTIYESLVTETNDLVGFPGYYGSVAVAKDSKGYNSNTTFDGGVGNITYYDSDAYIQDYSLGGYGTTCWNGVYTLENSNMGYSQLYQTPTGDQNLNFSWSSIAVNSETLQGDTLSGYRTALKQSGTVIEAGYTPSFFTTSNGGEYTVQADNYESCVFNKWVLGNSLSTFSTSNPLSVTGTENPQEYTAVYNCSGITVNSVNTSGEPITGYYATLYYGGTVIQSGYTPVTFTGLTDGSNYTLDVHNYGGCNFEKWQDTGGTNPERTVTAGEYDQTFTAVYSGTCS